MKAKSSWLVVLLIVGMAYPSQNPGAVFLMIWPAARPTSLGGAFTGIADDASCVYYNQGGLAFLERPNATLMHCNWLPGLWKGMYYEYLGFTHQIQKTGSLGVNVIYLTTGETDVVNEQGEYLGKYTTFDVSPSVGFGFPLLPNLGVGLSAKFIYSYLVPEWVWRVMPELGISHGGIGMTWAFDAGVLYKPWRFLSAGVAVANLGPNIAYTSSGESDPLPRMLRIGLAYYPVETKLFRVAIVPEVQKILVGMFYDPNHTKTFGTMLQEEVRDAWMSIGIEASAVDMVFARVGYFEDLTGARGGVVFKKDDISTHYGLYDLVTRRGLGKFEKIGLCFGFGIQFQRFKFDLGIDQFIYDFETVNRKFSFSYQF